MISEISIHLTGDCKRCGNERCQTMAATFTSEEALRLLTTMAGLLQLGEHSAAAALDTDKAIKLGQMLEWTAGWDIRTGDGAAAEDVRNLIGWAAEHLIAIETADEQAQAKSKAEGESAVAAAEALLGLGNG